MVSVSIILAVRDGSQYLSSAIESVLAQTFSNFELIIIVNCSTDNSLEIALSYSGPRVKILESNIGQLSYNLNLGLSEASGEYIARLDADDISLPSRLEELVQIANQESYDVLGSSVAIIDKNGKRTGKVISFPTESYSIRNQLWYRNPFAHPAVLIRKNKLLEVGGYLGGRYAQDFDLWLRLARNQDTKFGNVDNVLLEYRVHDNQSKGSSSSYAEVAGYLFRESLLTNNIKYFLGAFLYFAKAIIYGTRI